MQINPSCMATGTILDNISVRILFDTRTSKSYMSKSFYMAYKSLHLLPKFSTSSKGILVGNGQHVPVLFVIATVFTVSKHYFEIYTVVAEIHDGIDLVFGMKNTVETEGVLSARNGIFQFINRSIPIFPKLTCVSHLSQKHIANFWLHFVKKFQEWLYQNFGI